MIDKYLLTFEIDASIISKALTNISNKDDILFIPAQNHLVITNTMADETSTIRILDNECFDQYTLMFDLDEEKYLNLEYVDEEGEYNDNINVIYEQPIFAIETKDGALTKILSKIRGKVSFKFEGTKSDGTPQLLFVKDLSESHDRFEGEFKLYDSQTVFNDLSIIPERYNSRYVTFFEKYAYMHYFEEMETTLLELFDESVFSPPMVGKDSLMEMTVYGSEKDKAIINVDIDSATVYGHQYRGKYETKLLSGGNDAFINATKNNTPATIGFTVKHIEQAIKRHLSNIKHLLLIDASFDEIPLYSLMILSRTKIENSGSIYTVTDLYIQETDTVQYE